MATPSNSVQLQWLIDMLVPMINGAKQRRRSVENEWLLNYRAWQGWPSQTYALPLPDNAIHYFIPHLRRNIERNVARVTKLEMPNIDWHQTLPADSSIPHENAEAVHTTLRYILQKKIPVKRNINMLARCMYLYDFAILHTSVTIQNKEVWPYQRVIDPYSFYIYPDTALSLEDTMLLFEESIIPYQLYKSYVDKDEKKSIYTDISVDNLYVPEWPYHLIERIAYRGLTLPSDLSTGQGNTRYGSNITEHDVNNARSNAKDTLKSQSRAFVKLYKCYFRLGSEWFYTVICDNLKSPLVVRLDEEENSPTYRWSNSRPLPGELYTNSQADDNRVLQTLANTAISQVESNRVRSAEPPILMDSNAIGRMQSKTFQNREIWYVDGNPRDIIQSLDIADGSSEGIRAWQIYLGLIDKNSGGTIAEGNPGRNMPRSGSASMNLASMAMVEIEDIADTIEQDILTPSLGDIYHTILEYVPTKQLFKIPNKRPELVKAYAKRDLYGDYSFTWLGSLGFQDSQLRADKFMQFLTLILNPNILQIVTAQLEHQGLMLDIASALKTVYSFGLGEKGLGDIVIPIPQQVMQARAQQQQQSMQNNPQMLSVQAKQQEGQQRLQLEALKSQTTLQKNQIDLQQAGVELQGKVIELTARKHEIQGKDIERRQKHLEFLRSMYESSNNNNASNGD